VRRTKVIEGVTHYAYVVPQHTTRGTVMSAPVSIRLDDDVRKTLEAEARARNIGLATLLRQIAAEAARQAKRKRIREETEAVGRYIANNPEAKEFAELWGTPRQEGW
jgi:predicted transcriptional regulator